MSLIKNPFLRDFPGTGHRLVFMATKHPSAEQLIDRVCDGIDELGKTLMQPLALALSFGCYDKDYDFPRYDVEPRQRDFTLMTTPMHSGVVADSSGKDAEHTEVPVLTLEGIRLWMILASEQLPPKEGVITRWEEVRSTATCAKLHDYLPKASEFELNSYSGHTYRYPVVHNMNSTWVFGPTSDPMARPPLSFRITCDGYGTLIFDLIAMWSPWTEPGHAGLTEVAAFVARMIERGWHTPT